MEYFHVSNEQLNEGFKLSSQYGKKVVDPKNYTLSDHYHAQYLREMIIEDFRTVHFPDKPSRLNFIYLFDDIRLALKFKLNQVFF